MQSGSNLPQDYIIPKYHRECQFVILYERNSVLTKMHLVTFSMEAATKWAFGLQAMLKRKGSSEKFNQYCIVANSRLSFTSVLFVNMFICLIAKFLPILKPNKVLSDLCFVMHLWASTTLESSFLTCTHLYFSNFFLNFLSSSLLHSSFLPSILPYYFLPYFLSLFLATVFLSFFRSSLQQSFLLPSIFPCCSLPFFYSSLQLSSLLQCSFHPSLLHSSLLLSIFPC